MLNVKTRLICYARLGEAHHKVAWPCISEQTGLRFLEHAYAAFTRGHVALSYDYLMMVKTKSVWVLHNGWKCLLLNRLAFMVLRFLRY